MTLRYRVSLEGFVNVAQLQHSREAHWASFPPPAVCVEERGVQCVAASANDCMYIQYVCSLTSGVFLWCVCVCVSSMSRLCDSHRAAHPDHCHFIIAA